MNDIVPLSLRDSAGAFAIIGVDERELFACQTTGSESVVLEVSVEVIVPGEEDLKCIEDITP